MKGTRPLDNSDIRPGTDEDTLKERENSNG